MSATQLRQAMRAYEQAISELRSVALEAGMSETISGADEIEEWADRRLAASDEEA